MVMQKMKRIVCVAVAAVLAGAAAENVQLYSVTYRAAPEGFPGAVLVTAGYKGYGFGMVCEIMTAILSGGTTSEKVYRTPSGSGIAHFFMAIDPALFGDAREQSRRLSAFMAALRESSRADGAERIYVHGEKEEIARREVTERGVPVQAKTWEEMCEIASLTGTGDYLPSFALLSCCL